MEDGVKREVRVTIQRRAVKWQFKRSDEEQWNYDSPASKEDWDSLLERVENRYQRRTSSYHDLHLVRRCHAAATGAEAP
jgi:hypothetical protein